MLTLKAKPGVRWEVVSAIDAAQPIIAKAYKDAGSEAICTSGHDGSHSMHSAHKQNDPLALASAIDLRITNLFLKVPIHDGKEWWKLIQGFAYTLAAALNKDLKAGRFDVVIESNHLHCEFSDGKPPNIAGWHPEGFVWPTAEVKGYLA